MIYPEILEWIESEVILNPENSLEREYADISAMFGKRNRSTLEHILGDNKKEFLDILGSRLSELRDEPETDEEIGELERRVESLERSIEELLQPVTETVGAPFKVIEQEIKKTGIIESIKGFIRGLFS